MMKRILITLVVTGLALRSSAKDYPASLFGIHSDGQTLNTRSIQFAIDYIHQQGGGRLVFDVGRYLTGTIRLKSNVFLHLREGAVILGSLQPFDYERDGFTGLILAKGQQHIGVTGQGMIDGQGREVARNTVDLIHKGLISDPLRNDRANEAIRPMLIYFRECGDVEVRGILLRNAAVWVQTYDQCRKVIIDSVTVDSRAYWNNDGMDIVDCEDVVISHCQIDAADDGICLKSHDPARSCRNILVRDCTIRSSANGIKFGTASWGGFQQVKLINNIVFDTYRSAVALESVDGGILEDIIVDSLRLANTGHAIFVRLGARNGGGKGRVNNLVFRHVSGSIAASKPDAGYEYEGPVEDLPRNISPPVVIAGLPGQRISRVLLEDIRLEHPGGGNPNYARVLLNELDSVPEIPASYPEFSKFRELPAWGAYIRHASGIQLSGVEFICLKKDYRTAVVMDDVQGADISRLYCREPVSRKPLYSYRSENIKQR